MIYRAMGVLDEEQTDVTRDDETRDTGDGRRSWPRRVLAGAVVLVLDLVACVVGSVAAQDEPPTASGRLDFTGTYECSWPQTSGNSYEYACHEGNYAMGGIMRGARILEQEALTAGKRQQR